MARARVPQLNDTVVLELRLAPQTEEWAEELLAHPDSYLECERTDDALIVRYEVGGNCNAIVNAASFLTDVEEALREGDIDPMEFELRATAKGAA